MIELSIGDLHKIVALSTAFNAADPNTEMSAPLAVGPDSNRRNVQVHTTGVRIDPEDTLPDRDPFTPPPPA